MDELKKKQGKRLKEIRKLLGLSQAKFCDWLSEHNRFGHFQEVYSVKTIQAWEQGIRKVPDHIKKLLADNVTFNDKPVQYAYLNGDTDLITQSTEAIVKHAFEMMDSFNSPSAEGTSWKRATDSDIQELANAPLNRFAVEFLNNILPIYDHTKNDFFDIIRFNRFMYEEIGKLIEYYIQQELQGK